MLDLIARDVYGLELLNFLSYEIEDKNNREPDWRVEKWLDGRR